ncbi:hypothetical protein [Halovivax cerinus]|uniref:DUF7981 domain-containing protein n=1 Tax=Halovivax cerinus TaxID=1487865 RepID=A0ABD5NL17_9EURY|nr:hypothetical protein [Halovivax cerinus]
MHPRAKSALLWGIVGGLTFLVLALGVVGFETVELSIARVLAVGFVVTGATAAVTYRYERRLRRWASEHGR